MTGAPPPRSRGVIALLEANCTSCMLCVRECPDWCITVDSHQEELAAAPGGRSRAVNVLDSFVIDYGLCMYCGICVEVCPFDALFWAPAYSYPAGTPAQLRQGRDGLGTWTAAVPPPQAAPDDPAGNEPPAVDVERDEAPVSPSR